MKQNLSIKILTDMSKMLSKSIHDINNPFSVLMGQVSILEILLKKDELNMERIQGSIQKMKSGMEKMKSRMDTLRDYYKIPLNDANYQSWEAIKKSIDYLLLAQEEISLELTIQENCPFPCEVADSFLFIYHYYLSCDHQKPIKITVENGDDCIKIRGSGVFSAAQSDSILDGLFKKYNALITKNEEFLTIQIPA